MKNTAKAKPVFLLAGGRASRASDSSSILREVFCLSGKASPSVAVIGAANNDNPEFFSRMKSMFMKEGAGLVTLAPTCGRRYDAIKAGQILSSADIIHISGGDVEAGMNVLVQRKLVPVLRKLYKNGTVFFGFSAGSIMLAKAWVCWPDEQDDSSAVTFPCLGLANVYCDTHGEDDGWEELIALVNILPEHTTGYGICSGSALKVCADGKIMPVGPVAVYKKSRAKVELVR